MRDSFLNDIKIHFSKCSWFELSAAFVALLTALIFVLALTLIGGFIGYRFIEPLLSPPLFGPGAGTALGGGLGFLSACKLIFWWAG